MGVTAQQVDVTDGVDRQDFYDRYVGREPLVMRGAIADLPAVRRWSLDYFADIAPDAEVRLKTGTVSAGEVEMMRLGDYAAALAKYEAGVGPQPGYLHDVPLLSVIPQLRQDMGGVHVDLLPTFYRSQWWEFTQFFVGPAGAETPLHFDSLLTHNLFLQIQGTKRFVLVDGGDRDCCYPVRWRWARVDPENPDLKTYPKFQNAQVRSCVVEAGDLLYMPPGMLHKVVSVGASMSFNVDWHTARSALKGLAAIKEGMPITNFGYNILFALGLVGKVPARVILPALRSYFSYIS